MKKSIKDLMSNLQLSESKTEKSGHGQSKIKWESPDFDARFATKKEAREFFKFMRDDQEITLN